MADGSAGGSTAELEKKAQNAFFGKYRGVVKDNADPKKRGRLKLLVNSVFGATVTDWIIGAFPLGGNNTEGAIFVPKVDSHVLVEFIEGDRSRPVWTAAYYPEDAADGSAGAPPQSYDQPGGSLHMIRSEKGIEVRLEDDRADVQKLVILHPKGVRIEIDDKGTIKITDKASGEFLLDPDNKIAKLAGHSGGLLEMTQSGVKLEHSSTKIELSASGITFTGTMLKLDGDSVALGKGASVPLVNGTALMSQFAVHIHPTGVGPSSPPPAPLAGVLLTKVTGV